PGSGACGGTRAGQEPVQDALRFPEGLNVLSVGGEAGGQGNSEGGAAEDAEHGVAPPQVQACGGGQGQDVGEGLGRVGQGQVAQGVGDQGGHDAEGHAVGEVADGGAGAQRGQGGEGQGPLAPGDGGGDGDRGEQVGGVRHEFWPSFGRRGGPAGRW